MVRQGVLARAEPKDLFTSPSPWPTVFWDRDPTEGPPMGRGSTPPLAARTKAESLASEHVAIARGPGPALQLSLSSRNWAPAPAGVSQERILRSVLSYSWLPQFAINPLVQKGSDGGVGGWIFLLRLYSHREVSAADDWLVTPHHKNCDSLEIIMIISPRLTYLLLSLIRSKRMLVPFGTRLTPYH